jgi:quercetin dioxygenase-like cupin family protein
VQAVSEFFLNRGHCAHHEIFPGVHIHTASGNRLMLSLVEFEPHAVVPMHDHPHEQMGILLEGQLEFVIGGERRTLRAGEMWRIPGGVPHEVIAGDEPARALDVFHPIREEYR